MKRILMLGCAGVLAGCGATADYDFDGFGARASNNNSLEAVHERVLALDTHVDIPLDYATAANDPGGFTSLQVDLPKMRIGGLDAAFFIVYTPQRGLDEEGYAAAREIAETRYQAIARMTQAYPDQVGLATSVREVEEISRSGRIVALIGMENPYPLGASVEDVPMWAERGVRYISITHWGHNQFGDSSNFAEDAGERASMHGGLSPLGRELVVAVNRAGVMLDVSHSGRDTMLQAVELSAAPVVASHSGARAVSDNARNLDDEQLRAIAANNGVVQVVALGDYVRAPSPERLAAIEEIRQRHNGVTTEQRRNFTPEQATAYYAEIAALDQRFAPATVSQLVDHIDHVVAVAGIDHVGISSDFDGGGGIDGWRNASETMNVTAELMRRGYSEAEIAQIWSGNLLRVMRDAERVGERLRAE